MTKIKQTHFAYDNKSSIWQTLFQITNNENKRSLSVRFDEKGNILDDVDPDIETTVMFSQHIIKEINKLKKKESLGNIRSLYYTDKLNKVGISFENVDMYFHFFYHPERGIERIWIEYEDVHLFENVKELLGEKKMKELTGIANRKIRMRHFFKLGKSDYTTKKLI